VGAPARTGLEAIALRGRWRAATRVLVAAVSLALPLGSASALADHPSSDARVKELQVAASPALFPRFDPGVADYVTRCGHRRRLKLRLAVPRGATVAVDRRAPRRGSFSASVRVSSGRSFRLVMTKGQRRKRYFVRCLPPDFPKWTAERPGRPQAAWYVVAPCCTKKTYVAVFDNRGVPVWWINTHRVPVDASLLPDGHVVWAQQHGRDLAPGISSGVYEEHGLDGKRVRTFPGPGGIPTDRHEMQLLPNGDYVVVAYSPRDGVDLTPYGGPANATVLDAVVKEVTPERKLAWSWRSSDHIDLSETDRWYGQQVLDQPVKLLDGRMAYDIVHINAVEPHGRQGFLVSLRHTDAVYDIDKASGDVLWKLGGTQTPRSLAMIGDDVADLGGQHDVRVLPDGSITLHDNGTGRGRGPRALRFRVDRDAMTATLVEQVSDPDAGESPCCGSARKLPGGHWVVSWGGTHLIEELTAAGRRVFALRFPLDISYRVFPVQPGRLTRRELRAGMDAMYRSGLP
jgi:Arylsulfotransferase (ASST)